MSLFQLTLDPASQAALDRVTTAIGLLTTAIQQQGSKALAAIDNLTAELQKFTQTDVANKLSADASTLQSAIPPQT